VEARNLLINPVAIRRGDAVFVLHRRINAAGVLRADGV
jgi:hypothetical protein